MLKRVLQISVDAKGVFVTRENRFLGIVDIVDPVDEKRQKVHIRDPGRLDEILYSGNQVLLKKVVSEHRKTAWDLIAGSIQDFWVFIHSGYHREIAEWVLDHEQINPFGEINDYTPEQQFGESRLDFLVEKEEEQIWIEVKGCTLARNNIALFPDAPTERGRRHLHELIQVIENGDSAGLFILVFRPDAECFKPNEKTDLQFGEVFHQAREKRVNITPLQFMYRKGNLFYIRELPLC